MNVMKAKLFFFASLFALTCCTSSPKSKGSNKSSSFKTSQTSKTSGKTITSTTSGITITSRSSSSISSVTPSDDLEISTQSLTIDLKDSSTATLTALYEINPEQDISWSAEKNNNIYFTKTTTKSGEQNTIEARNTGSTRIYVRVGEKVNYCDVSVVITTVKKTSGTETITIYGVNDYHGHVTGDFNIAKYGTYIKEKVNQPNTLFLDQGDTWQGTLESNYNYGKLITDVYNAAGMSARSVGNHDFDWGQPVLKHNTAANYHGYSTPTLACNVYDYDMDTHTVGTTQQADIGQEYVTFTLESGIKVGVVGGIGQDQETSICTPFVKDIEFVQHAPVYKAFSDYLRVEEQCDVIIFSIHQGLENVEDVGFTNVSPTSGKKYCDLILTGHTHEKYIKRVNNVPICQFGEYNQIIGEVKLTFNYETNSISGSEVAYKYTSSLADQVTSIDSEIQTIYDYYNSQTESVGAEVLAPSVSGTFDSYTLLPNLVCKAIYDETVRQGYDVSFVVCNNGRADLPSGQVRYSDLYEALPFDNVIYIATVSGLDLYNEVVQYRQRIYRSDNDEAKAGIKYDKTYTIACIDYLLFHQNANREYNYFSSFHEIGFLLKNSSAYTYREITADYMRNYSGTLSTSNFSASSYHHNSQRANVSYSDF